MMEDDVSEAMGVWGAAKEKYTNNPPLFHPSIFQAMRDINFCFLNI